MALLQTPKFGDLNIDGYSGRKSVDVTADFMDDPNSTYGYILNSDKGAYVYVPNEVFTKGVVNKATNTQYYSPKFLGKDYLSDVYSRGQPVDLEGFKGFEQDDLLFRRLNEMGYGTKGVLLPFMDANVYVGTADWKNYKVGTSLGNASFGEIKGVGQKDGELVYLPSMSGTKASGYINADVDGLKASWGRGGLVGEFASAIADIPFIAEISGLIAASNPATAAAAPYIYAGLKGTQLGAQGVDPLEAALRVGGTMAIAGAVNSALSSTPTMTAGGGPAELASVGETGYGLTGPIVEPTTATAIGGLLTPVDYSLTAGTQLPTQAAGMGAGGVKVDLPPLPEPSAIGTQPIDYSLTGQTMPGILGGIGLQTPTMPNIGTMGGAQGLTVPVEGGTVGQLGATSVGATPSLGDPSSFINQPDVLGQPVIQQGTPSTPAISVKDALRGAQLVNKLLTPEQQAAPNLLGRAAEAASQMQGGVDYSTLLGLLAQRPSATGLLGTRYQPQPINIASLLG